jgi:hypothetical protein
VAERLGPFQYIYTARERKQRDVLEHLIAKYGVIRTRAIVSTEAHAAAWAYDLPSEQHQYWYELKVLLEAMENYLSWGKERGL